MILELAYYGDPILRKKAEAVKEISPFVKELAQNMLETMLDQNGVGIAAPQVKQALRIFWMRPFLDWDDKDSEMMDPICVINPRFFQPSEVEVSFNEGCLSIPGIYEEVYRPETIRMQAMNLEAEPFEMALEGHAARVAMHENDHLNGVLFIDRLSSKQKKSTKAFLQKVKKKYGN